MRGVALFFVSALFASSQAAAPALAKPRPAPPLAGLDAYVARTLNEFGMLLECSPGKEAPAGRTCVLKPKSIRRLWSAQTVQGTPDPPAGLEPLKASFAAYGLGFGLRDYRGRKIVSHTGGLPGYLSLVTLVPEERLGVVVLTNQEENGAFEAVRYDFSFDHQDLLLTPVLADVQGAKAP